MKMIKCACLISKKTRVVGLGYEEEGITIMPNGKLRTRPYAEMREVNNGMFYNIDMLKNKMKEYNLDAIIATTKENIRYFTGFEPVLKTLRPYSGECYVVITVDRLSDVNLVHSVGEIDQVLDSNVNMGSIRTYGKFYREYNNNFVSLSSEEKKLKELTIQENRDTPHEALLDLIKELGLKESRVGIDEDGISGNTLNFIKNNLSKLTIINFSTEIRKVRSIKTPLEIKALTKAASCVEIAIQDVIDNIRNDISEVEIVDIFNSSIVRQGALPVLPMIKIGRHAVGGQRLPKKENRLQAGDLIWFDCDVVCNGYWADIARVFSYKYLKPEYQKFEALYKGQLFAIQEVKQGMTGKDVFNLTMQAVREFGLSEYKRHHVGHGIGLEPYELPVLSPDNEEIIENGMVLSIETPYYEFGLGALHVEDPIYIQENGNKLLTQTSGNIKVVG